jgi:tRNA-specific 2-thiouridylase
VSERPLKVIAAMSGGVDSAVAAARAVAAGYDVTGVHLALSRTPATLRTGARGCCSREDAGDARRAADVLGIPFYIWDLADRFQTDVIDDFVDEYAAGRTPNPCLRCNEKIKFSAVLDRALALGYDAVVTGHHARLRDGVLMRSVDLAKDQSYVLAVLDRRQLAHSVFPLGDSTKAQVRAEAAQLGLAVADKPDSHDICFIPDGDTRGFLAARLGARPGPIVDDSGETVGAHQGAFGYTIGQRHGLRLSRPAADGQPRYVIELRPSSNTVVVGPRAALAVDEIRADRVVWTAGSGPSDIIECLVQVRAHSAPVPAVVTIEDEGVGDGVVVARLRAGLRGIAAGQALVMYDGDTVLGCATITATSVAAITATSVVADPTGRPS